MKIPGLIEGASRIHRPMFFGVFSIVPAPRSRRSPTSVRAGPTVPVADVPAIV